MSYLDAVRLHFAGQFQANVSTVNNDPAHFDNAAFKPSYQDMQDAQPTTSAQMHGWFNPQGDAAFRLKGCQVTSAWTASGPVDAADPIGHCLVADSGDTVPAKLVDLDSEQQLVSTIWGLTVRICDSSGSPFLTGTYEPAAFIDIWDQATGSGHGDIGAGAAYQSVLTDLRWADVSASRFLTELQGAAAETGELSIKFMVDGLNMQFTSPDFMCGRIVGTIGPALAHEPRHFVAGRHFMPDPSPNPANFFKPIGGINFCTARVDEATSTLFLDLGNALATETPGGAIDDIGDLRLGVYVPGAADESELPGEPLGTVPARGPGGYTDPGWYPRTAGVTAFPLSADQLALATSRPLTIHAAITAGLVPAWVRERPAGTYLRADTFVYRMSPGDSIDIPVHATQWGKPLAGATVDLVIDNDQLQSQVGPDQFPFVAASPPVGVPTDVLSFPPTLTTDQRGIAVLTVTAGDPGHARWIDGRYGIDGQVYGVRPSFADPAYGGPVNQWDFISFLVWSGFDVPERVTWTDVQPIFQQYANLYPVMMRFLDLADDEQLKANAGLLKLAFSLPLTDPNTMPVTRDLSPAKRRAVLAWLDDPVPGTIPPVVSPPADVESAAPAAASPDAALQGGKAAAAARRLVHARHRTEVSR